MKKILMIVLLTVVPSALSAETPADKQDLGAARESASVEFDRLTAKDAGSSVVMPEIGSPAENEEQLVITESRKKAIASNVPAVSGISGNEKADSSAARNSYWAYYHRGQAIGEMAGIAASAAILLLGGAPALLIASAIAGAAVFPLLASKDRPLAAVAACALGAVVGYVFPAMLVVAGGVFLGPKVAGWLQKRNG